MVSRWVHLQFRLVGMDDILFVLCSSFTRGRLVVSWALTPAGSNYIHLVTTEVRLG